METLNKNLLISLFNLAQADMPASVEVLSQCLGVSRRDVADGLDELARLGLVRAETVRLTFVGLAQALRWSRVKRQPAARQGAAA